MVNRVAVLTRSCIADITKQISSGRLKIHNPVFEITPRYENVKFISEAGPLTGKDIAALAQRIEGTWKFLET
jgi:hypothetical protein